MTDLSKIIQKFNEMPEKSYRIVAFGSSNTELFWHSGGRHNWVDWLNINIRHNIGKNILIINQGICGETSEDLLRRFERDVLPLSPEIVIVTIGGNDAARGFTYDQYYSNIKEICTKLIEKKIQPVLQTYYCPLYEEFLEGYKEAFESFVEANRAVAEEMELPLIDQYSYFEPLYTNERKEYGKLMLDMLHVNHIGNMIMGIIASRYFGLPDPNIPEDINTEVQTMFEKILYYYNKQR